MGNNYKSVFDIIGPIMIGPSSSHTAGAVKIGKVGFQLFNGQMTKLKVRYYESFAKTHRGHGTDFATVAGVLGFNPDDSRCPQSIQIAEKMGIEIQFIEDSNPSPINHPNSVELTLENETKKVELMGCSIGGGAIEIREFTIKQQQFFPKGSLPILVLEANPVNKEAIKSQIETTTSVIQQSESELAPDESMYEYDLTRNIDEAQLKQLRLLTHHLIYLK
ncbi:serine dehydratase beta chain [Dellaglioa sp. BT-FLS60]